MSEMDLLKRIEALENKVAELENTLNTIGMMEKSERITEYLQNRRRNQSLVSLVNSMSDEEIVISHQEAENEKRMAAEQKQLELQIKNAIQAEKNSTYYAGENEHLFSYVFNPTGITITGYNGFNSDTLVIPSAINGVVVTEIGNDVFKNSSCRMIIIPDSVICIGEGAFRDSKNLVEVKIGNRVEVIGSCAFSYCSVLSCVCLPHSLMKLGSWCFSYSGINSITIPSGVKSLPYGCFSHCNKLTRIIISEGVAHIDENAFEKCNLKEIIFPNSLIDVHTELFGMLGNNNCKLIFLGLNTVWRSNKSAWPHNYIVYCKIGSQMLQSSRQLGCKVHPLSEYYDNR